MWSLFIATLFAATVPLAPGEVELTKREANKIKREIQYGNLSPYRWEQLPGKIITVDATSRFTLTGIVLDTDKQYLIVPQPRVLWHNANGDQLKYRFVDYRGNLTQSYLYRNESLMALCYRIRETGPLTPVYKKPFLKGQGELFLEPNDGILFDNKGEIRVKILTVKHRPVPPYQPEKVSIKEILSELSLTFDGGDFDRGLWIAFANCSMLLCALFLGRMGR
jgi:hypothetical protein